MSRAPARPIPSQLLRRLTKTELLAVLRRHSAAPFHVILWDSRPVRLSEALGWLELQPEDTYFYAAPEHVYSGNTSIDLAPSAAGAKRDT